MKEPRYYLPTFKWKERYINRWDLITMVIVFSCLFLLALGARQMTLPYQIGESIPITLDPLALPFYAVRTVLRLFIALLVSLLMTFIFGTWAAKSERAEKIIIPAVDILQSVPVLSFLSITVVGFIRLFPNSMLGPECASIFAIFTSQVWNMLLGMYQSLRTVPHDLKELSDVFRLSGWQRFWRIEVPFSMSSLIWNMMMSMSASWFFVVLSEAISVSDQNIHLPGIGSYIATAIDQADMHAVFYAIMTMLIVILIYDQLIFRPLVNWSEKFKFEIEPSEVSRTSWFMSLLHRTVFLSTVGRWWNRFVEWFVAFPFFKFEHRYIDYAPSEKSNRWLQLLWSAGIATALAIGLSVLFHFVLTYLDFKEVMHVLVLGMATALRVIALIIISSLIWIPVGVWIGQRPQVAQIIQPIIQFIAAFPANLIYPIVVLGILYFHLNVEIWVTPLMILGTQWYILFNVIAGATNIPKDIYQVAQNLHVKGWLWWKRVALPGIFPYFVTGAITAAGGAWNASIVAEWVSWGNTTLRATGLGEYIHQYTVVGDFPRIALGTVMMSMIVVIFNWMIWRPLYRMAESRYSPG